MARALVLVALLTTACAPAPATVVVDLRSDWVPGRELAQVRVRVEGVGAPVTRALDASEDLLGGVRIAEIPGVESGPRVVVAELLRPDGSSIATRRTRVSVEAARVAVTVLATRDCAGIECPASDAARTECFAAACVPEGCSGERLTDCGEAECAADTDCAPASACAAGRCQGGFCFQEALPDACGAGRWCDPTAGCQLEEDPCLAPTTLVCEGFDAALGPEWEVDPGVTFSGSAMRSTTSPPDAPRIRRTFPAVTGGTLYARAHVRVLPSDTLTGWLILLELKDSTFVEKISYDLESGVPAVTDELGGGHAAGVEPVPLGDLLCIELEVEVDDLDGRARVSVDGALAAEVVGVDTLPDGGIAALFVGPVAERDSVEVVYEDVYLGTVPLGCP